ncbi:RING-H2 finger protein ATL13-like [Curcuma longa]|uniref:RING-H2 finger protein ATL13-like n=1 Tax=Curcuma longa TaxID=136217 RepID=UPI003D9ED1C0
MLLLPHQSMARRSLLSTPPPPPPLVDFGGRITPSILLIIVILAIIFFVSGLLHLFVRYFLRPSNRDPDETEHATAFQGELQQLFHLHDAGVDQSFIDALPIFQYKSIASVKDPFDCAVCLCEFEADDKLRLLPKCSHAFHIQCIDVWLLSHSTCPLCRASLLHDLSPGHSSSPMLLVLESGGESSSRENDFNSQRRESVSIDDVGDETAAKAEEIDVAVKLGKFRSVEISRSGTQGGGGGGGSSSREVDQRRCFSMGPYEYMMEERSTLRVSIKPVKSSASFKKPGGRSTRSEYDCNSRRDGFNGFDAAVNSRGDEQHAHKLHDGLPKRESFSVSKIWLRQRKEEAETRRAVSFRLPAIQSGKADLKLKQSSSPSAMADLDDSNWWSKNVSELELDSDVEAGGFHDGAVSRVDETPSFARRTLLWITGKQNKVDNCV